MWVVKRAISGYSTGFAAMLQNKLRVICCPFLRTLKKRVAYRIDVHTVPDRFWCRHVKLSGMV